MGYRVTGMRRHAHWIGGMFLAAAALFAAIGYDERSGFNPFYIAAAGFAVVSIFFFFYGASKRESRRSTTFDLKNVRSSKFSDTRSTADGFMKGERLRDVSIEGTVHHPKETEEEDKQPPTPEPPEADDP